MFRLNCNSSGKYHGNKSIFVSVIVCTFNRADRLKDCLAHLARQDIKPIMFEVLVIDNLCTDHTVSVFEDACVSYPKILFRLLKERERGLGHARNHGLREASGEYIAYIDDDSNADPAWLHHCITEIQKDPRISCVGGPIFPYYTSVVPKWFKDQYEIRTLGPAIRHLVPGECFSGSNMMWRTSTLRQVGGFSTEFGMKGRALGLGEETAAFQALWAQQPDAVLVYTPHALVQHWTPPDKMTVSYRLKRAFYFGIATERLRHLQFRRGICRLPKLIAGLFYKSLVSIMSAFRHDVWQQWACEEASVVVRQIGKICGFLQDCSFKKNP